MTGAEVIAVVKEEILKEQKLGSVLELGCGTGLYTEALQKVASKVLATDFSDEMIEAANQKRGSLENVIFMKAMQWICPLKRNVSIRCSWQI